MGRKMLTPVSIGLEHELDLPEFIVTNKEEKDGDILYTVSAKTRPACWNCGYESPAIHSTNIVYVADLPRFGNRVGLRIEKRRYECPRCKTNTPDEFTSYQGKMTVRLRERIKDETLYRPFTKLSEEYGCSATNIDKLFQEKRQECAKRYHPVTPVSLAIDRITMHDGKTMYTVLIDLDRDKANVIEMSNATSAKAVEACLGRISDASRCRRVFLDLHEDYRTAVRHHFGNQVLIIVDKNHVLQELYSAFNDIRIELSKKNIGRNRDRAFTANRILLGTDYEKLSQRQSEHLKDLLANYPEFNSAYELKEAFLNIYGADNAESAKSYYQEWKDACLSEGETGYDAFIHLIDSWYDEVFAYFDNTGEEDKITAAKAAVLQVDREGFRYKFEVLRAKIIYRNLASEPLAKVMDFDKFK